MNKSSLIEQVSEKTNLPKEVISQVVDAACQTIIQSLEQKKSVMLAKFGKFETCYRHARNVRNPKTGELIRIAENFSPVFRPSAYFKQQVEQSLAQTAEPQE